MNFFDGNQGLLRQASSRLKGNALTTKATTIKVLVDVLNTLAQANIRWEEIRNFKLQENLEMIPIIKQTLANLILETLYKHVEDLNPAELYSVLFNWSKFGNSWNELIHFNMVGEHKNLQQRFIQAIGNHLEDYTASDLQNLLTLVPVFDLNQDVVNNTTNTEYNLLEALQNHSANINQKHSINR